MTDADLRFRATLDDDVSSKVDDLEKKLKKMGASPAQIKMIINAQDNTEPTIKKVRERVAQLGRDAVWHLSMNTDMAMSQLHAVRKEADKPIKLSFITNLDDVADKVFSLRSRVPIPLGGSIPGANMLQAYGPAGLGIGAVAAGAGLVQQGVQVNSTMEQSQITLNQTLKDNTKATQEMSKLVTIAKQTPFNYQDVLQADVRLRSYNIPTMKGEGGPQNKGWLNSAGDMAAAMNTPITQAVEAIADARQGYFVRMMSYGVRMMREDFQAGGKYAGMTYEQGLEQAIRRFTGAQEAQSKTFQGIMSNIKDVVQQSIIRPAGAVPFALAKQTGQNFMDMLQSNSFQTKAQTTIETISHKMIELYGKVQQGKQYFMDYLLQPLMSFSKQVISIGATFVETFGHTFATVLKTVATLFAAVVKPIADFVSHHEALVQIYAVYKALSILGFDTPVSGLSKMTKSLSLLHPSITGVLEGFKMIVSSSVKLGVAALVAEFTKGVTAANNLKMALQDVNKESAFTGINAELSRMALGLDTNTAKMKQLGAQAILGLKPGTSPEVGVYQARMAQVLSQYGINAGQANQLMSKTGIGSDQDVDRAATALRELKAASDALKMTFTDSVRVMNQFSGQANPIGLGGLRGAPYLGAMSAAMHDKGFALNTQQHSNGLFTGDALMTQLLGAYRSPSVDQIQALGAQNINKYYKFNKRGGTSLLDNDLLITQDTASRYQANINAQRDLSSNVNSITRQAGMKNNLKIPSLVDDSLPSKVPNLGPLLSAKTGAGQANALTQMQDFNAQQLAAVNKELDDRTQKINVLNKALNQWQMAQDALSNAMTVWQHDNLQPMQRQLEDLQLATAQYQQSALRPLERQMQSLSDQSTILSNRLNVAQYDMQNFNTGLLDGEQAALNQLHALEKYNRQLQILQLQYQTMGAQLGQTTYDGASAVMRVNPLSQVSLEYQMQEVQRKQQLKQAQYDAKYGEGHYQMQQAARSAPERTEMSLKTRLDGIKNARTIMDQVAQSQQNLTEKQGAIQEKVNKVNENLADQQDAITNLSNALQDKTLHGGLRAMEDAQYAIGQKTYKANQELTRQNTLLAAAQDHITDFRDIGKELSDTWGKIWQNQSPADAANALVNFSFATGMIDGKQKDQILKMLAKAGDAVSKNSGVPKDKSDWIDTITRGIKMFFTGDGIRLFTDQLRQVPGIGGVIGGNGATAALTGVAAALGAVTLVPLALGIIRQVIARGVLGPILKALPGDGIDELAGKFGRGLSKIPGVRNAETVKNLAEGGGRGALTEFAAGGKFLDMVKDSLQFIKRFRGIVGGVIGATVGSIVGGPVGGVLGGIAGTKYGRGKTVRSAASDTKKLVDKFGDGADKIKLGGEKVKNIGEEAKKIGEEAKKIKLRGVGKFAGAITIFAAAIDGIKELLKKILPDKVVKKAKDFFHDESGVARVAEPIAAGADAARAGKGAVGRVIKKAAGSKIARAAGKAGRIVNRAAAPIIVGSDIAEHNYNAALNDGSYFVPGVGEAHIGYDLITAMTHTGSKNTQQTQAAVERAMKAFPHQIQGRPGYGADDPNLSEAEKESLQRNKILEVGLAGEIMKRLKHNQDVSDLSKKLITLQEQYDTDYDKFSANRWDESKTSTTKFYDDLGDVHKKYVDDRTTREQKGYQDISDTTDRYSRKLTDQVKKFRHELGITGTGVTTSDGQEMGAIGATNRGGMANGTELLRQHLIKGKGDSKGYMVRVGEEGDEAIVPLAPHRRERAKSLLSQIAGHIGYANGGFIASAHPGTDGAYLAARKGVMGYANGGFVYPLGAHGKMIGVPYQGTHAVAFNKAGGSDNWESENAVDIATPIGTKVLAVAKGIIGSQIGSLGSGGRFAGLRLHLQTASNDYYYAHLSKLAVKAGEKVAAGMILGLSGEANGIAHLHFADEHGDPRSLLGLPITGGSSAGGGGYYGAGTGSSGAGFGISIPGTPRKLKGMGIVGQTMFHVLSEMKKKAGSGSMGGGIVGDAFKGGHGAAQAKKWTLEAMKRAGVSGGDWLNMLLRQESRESGFDPNVTNNWDVNAKAGNPSRGIMQITGTNFKQFGTGNIFNPVDNISAAIKYIISTYGHGNQSAALAHMIANGGSAYAAGSNKINRDWMPAILHRGEKVLNPQQTGVDDTKARNLQKWIGEMSDNLKAALKQLTHANDRDDKAGRSLDLSKINAAVRANYKQGATPSASKIGATGAGGGEATVAKVADETREFHITVSADLKSDSDLVKEMSALTTAAKDLNKTASTPHQKQLAEKAVKAAETAHTAAKKVTDYEHTSKGKAAAKEVSRNKYLVSAAKRGVNSKLIKGITGKALSTKQNLNSAGHLAKKGQKKTSQKALYEKAAKDKPGSKQQSKDIKNLQAALKTGLSAAGKKLDTLRSTATKDASKARKDYAAAAKSQIKSVTSLSKTSQKTLKELQGGHKVSTSSLKKLDKEITAAHNTAKAHKKDTEDGNKSTKDVSKSSKDSAKTAKASSTSRDKADAAADKREKDHYKKVESFQDKLLAMDFAPSVHVTVQGGKVKASVTPGKKRK